MDRIKTNTKNGKIYKKWEEMTGGAGRGEGWGVRGGGGVRGGEWEKMLQQGGKVVTREEAVKRAAAVEINL